MNSSTSTITLTFGDSAENHVGMEKLGTRVAIGEGFTPQDLQIFQTNFQGDLYSLQIQDELPTASVLVLRNGVQTILSSLGKTSSDLFQEQASLNVDKQAYMYGRVVKKHARWNLCFDEEGHDPDYARGKGRVVAYRDVPITFFLKEALPRYFGPKANHLKCEANYYYDASKCGIGFHGDTERRKVIGVRLGASLDLHFQWFKDNTPLENGRIVLPLHHGDIYIMSEKAVGTDWKQKSIYTLRHATGAAKYTTL